MEFRHAHDVGTRQAHVGAVAAVGEKHVLVALHVGAHHEGAGRVRSTYRELVLVVQLGVTGAQAQLADLVVGSQVEAVLAAGAAGLLMHGPAGFERGAAQAGGAIGDLVCVAGRVGVQRIRRRTGVVVVVADEVSGGVVGLRSEVAQTQHAEATGKVHFALAAEESGACGAGAGVKAAFQLEACHQTAAQVFLALEAEAGGVVEQAGLGHIAFFLVLERGVDPAVQGDAALCKGSRRTHQGQRGEGAAVNRFH
ncbi:hypothetical protein D3C71_1009650 [compost metagenome]